MRLLRATGWAELEAARSNARTIGAEGLMLKRWTSAYGAGRRRGVPFAKAYSGLTDDEIRRVDAFVRRNTVEKFGPVRTVRPELVFELAFEGIQRPTRQKSGIAVRFPRLARRRTDQRPEQADTLQAVRALIDERATPDEGV